MPYKWLSIGQGDLLLKDSMIRADRHNTIFCVGKEGELNLVFGAGISAEQVYLDRCVRSTHYDLTIGIIG